MPNGITISGLDDCLKAFDKAPANLLKMSRTAMRAGAKPVVQQIRQQTPKRFRKLVKSRLVRMRSGDTNVLIGLFNNHAAGGYQPKTGKRIDDWFKAYWANYGTITRRDPGHKFESPVKRPKYRYNSAGRRVLERRNNVGQSAQNFFDRAVAGFEARFIESFQESLKNQEANLRER